MIGKSAPLSRLRSRHLRGWTVTDYDGRQTLLEEPDTGILDSASLHYALDY